MAESLMVGISVRYEGTLLLFASPEWKNVWKIKKGQKRLGKGWSKEKLIVNHSENIKK